MQQALYIIWYSDTKYPKREQETTKMSPYLASN